MNEGATVLRMTEWGISSGRGGIRVSAGWAVLIGFLIGLVGPAAEATDRYVSASGTNDVANGYDTWSGASTTIQAAIDVCDPSDVVWVEDGFVCNTGGVANWPGGSLLTNRIAITEAITVRSVSGDPANTVIEGAWDPSTTCGVASVRCVYMAPNSTLIGFTLKNGSTCRTNESANAVDLQGGGLYADSGGTPVVTDCVITNNIAFIGGGGACHGHYFDCEFRGNRTMDDYTYPHGAGLRSAYAYRCKFIGNRGKTTGGTVDGCGGGGAYASSLYNCLLIGNSAAFGGGTYVCSTYNCTIVGNRSYTHGSGVFKGTHDNAIVYSNYRNNYYSTTFSHSSTTPAIDGWDSSNTTNAPLFEHWGSGYGVESFVEGNYRQQRGSPCVDTGMNGSWTTSYPLDLDLAPRIVNGIVDMGAYELPHPAGTVVVIR